MSPGIIDCNRFNKINQVPEGSRLQTMAAKIMLAVNDTILTGQGPISGKWVTASKDLEQSALVPLMILQEMSLPCRWVNQKAVSLRVLHYLTSGLPVAPWNSKKRSI